MGKFKRTIFLITSFLLSSISVAAEEEEVTFQKVADAAFLNSPALARMKNRILQQRAEAVSLRTLKNPELGAEVRPYVSDAKGNETEYEIALSQPLKLSFFSKRGSVAELIDSAVNIEEKIALNEMHQSMLLLYGKVWAMQQKEIFIKDAEKRVKTIYARVSDKKQGLFPESTVKLFEASSLKLSGQLLRIQSDKSRALAAITNQTSEKFEGKRFSALTLAPLSEIKELKAEERDIPLISRIRMRSKIANQQYELARLDSFPEFAPRIAFEHVDNGTDRVNVGLTVELPFFDRNQAGRVRASGEQAEQNAMLRYAESGALMQELNLMLQAAQSSEKQSIMYRDKILPVLSASLNAAEHEFNSGQGNPFQIWQTVSELIETQDAYLELWVKALSERVELYVLYGMEIQEKV